MGCKGPSTIAEPCRRRVRLSFIYMYIYLERCSGGPATVRLPTLTLLEKTWPSAHGGVSSECSPNSRHSRQQATPHGQLTCDREHADICLGLISNVCLPDDLFLPSHPHHAYLAAVFRLFRASRPQRSGSPPAACELALPD